MPNSNYGQTYLYYYKQQRTGQESVSIFHLVHAAKGDTRDL